MPKKRMLNRWTILASAGLLATTITAHTQLADKSNQSDLPGVLKHAVDSASLTVNRQFETNVPGVTGYVIEADGQYQVVYGEDGYLFMGRLISPDGKNLSAEYTDQYVPKPDIAKVVEQLKDSDHLVQQGPDDAPLIYVFADPNCTYCHRLYQQADALVKAGKLQLQWAMVGFVKESSVGRAAAILSAEDPVAALVENEAGFDEDTDNGGIAPVDSPSEAIRAAIDSYAKQMAATGSKGTPTLVYKQDGEWVSKVGAPGTACLQEYLDKQN